MIFPVITALCLSSVFGSAIVPRKNPSGRIVGGEVAGLGQFPFVASIIIETPSGRHSCVGTLISTQWVLTSAFCVNGGIRFNIILGAVDLKDHGPNAIALSTSIYHVHPLFNPSILRNDIGLIEFHIPIHETDYVKPIDELAVSVLPNGVNVVTCGWGQINDKEPAPVDRLSFVHLASISNAECQRFYGNAIIPEMVCVAGNDIEGTCIGDMGAPLLQHPGGSRFVHVGLASFIHQQTCESTDPSGFTRTFHYRDWIRNLTGV